MVNSAEFAKRLKEVIAYYGESASSFSEKIGVQRSSISHILSGRNKPSLEFVMKVLTNFPEVELYWLLNGNGSFPKKDNHQDNTHPTPINQISAPIEANKNSNRKIDRIIIFYTDGSFESFEK